MTAASRPPCPARRRLLAAGVGVLALGLGACVSTDALHPNRGGMSFVVRGRRYDEIWNAGLKAMSTDMHIVESHKPSGTIKSRVGTAPGGKVVGFFIQPTVPAEQYMVTVVSKAWTFPESPNARDWEPSVVEDFKAALAAGR